MEFVKFTPGEYLDLEKDAVQLRLDIAAGKAEMPPMGGPFGKKEPKPYTQEEIIAYNKKWDPYNPLFNDPEYAKKAGYADIPAYPGFCMAMAMGAPGFDKTMPSGGFYYTNDGTDIYLSRPVVAGDFLKPGESKGEFYEVTEPGSELRQWYMGGEGTLVDEDGTTVVHSYSNTRDCYKQYVDPAKHKDLSENMAEWCDYFPPAHYTSDEDWDYIRQLWSREEIRGAEPRYWEDVEVGTFMTETCSGPITYMDMITLYGNGMPLSRQQLCDKEGLKKMFRDPYGNYLFETSIHLGTRNLPNGRMVFYNDTAARLLARTVTNWIGDAGYVSRFCWRFFPFFKEMRNHYVPKDYDLIARVVPGYENRPLNRHGSEGDTVIGKAYIYDKRVDELGRHVIDICAWGETLDGDIIQVCPMQAVLPTRG